MSKTIPRIAAFLPALLLATTAAALVTSATNDIDSEIVVVANSTDMQDVRKIDIYGGPNTAYNPSNYDVYYFDELQCIDPNSLAVGTTMPFDNGDWTPNRPFSCHLVFHPVYHDPLPNSLTISFDDDIIGYVSSSSGLDTSDEICSTGALTYPLDNAEPDRGLESPDLVLQPGPRTAEIFTDGGSQSLPLSNDAVRIITRCGSGSSGGAGW